MKPAEINALKQDAKLHFYWAHQHIEVIAKRKVRSVDFDFLIELRPVNDFYLEAWFTYKFRTPVGVYAVEAKDLDEGFWFQVKIPM